MTTATLLLVEDDPALSELLEYRFANEGYRVRATADEYAKMKTPPPPSEEAQALLSRLRTVPT